MSNIALKIENLVKRYPSVLALKGISFEIKEKELFALLGPNGAGKTTIIRIISGLTQPTSGNIYIFNKSIFNNPIWAKNQIGIVPQTINLDLELSVEENLLIHGFLYRMSLDQIKKRIEELLELADLTFRRKSKIKELSGGMRRRVLIIRALMHNPKILLLDEPTVGLDPHIRRKIWSFIKNIQSNGTTILLTTHYMEEAEILADRVAFIFSGKIIDIDTPKNFVNRLGNYALDVYLQNKTKTFYFKSKDEAEQELLRYSKKYFVSLRRVNLEDVFLTYMEKKK
ncbi:ABC transporter ATP-binding protein [Thermodesulfobacterium hydrogeniphilum]|uniref:ABC transporter ATP-binding protein n=1 Tax=Thermodesulfobacterium hydrogeniphilum TaxID=161156 RepID=UPI00068B22FF|nr:ABC transporter ATP-binding protein [Thermodesulfobacterium hydrogeniphilum]